ncbi:unnamed protein product [Symbiodinium sp. CCMP2456]|nr:unnamed protein product [Symbiodinium sp. CCMP2456]
MQGYGSFARFGPTSMCRGCSHSSYYHSWKGMWAHQAFAVNPITGKVLMYREGRLIYTCSNVFPADDMDDFFVVTAARAANGDVYNVKIFKDEFKSQEEIIAEMRYAPHPDRAVEFLSYDKKELQDFGQRGTSGLYLVSVTAMAWVHVKSKLSGEHPIFTWNEESRTTESKSAVGGGLQPGQGHGIYLNMGKGRCEGGDLDAPEGSWVHVAFAFDDWEMLICIEKIFCLGGKVASQSGPRKTAYLFKDGKLVKTCTDYENSIRSHLHLMSSAARAGGDMYDFKLYRTPIIEAIRFLEQSHVTRDMLDYFTSEEGQQVLQAYREKRAEPAQVEASEAAPGRGLCGRQKISAAVRSNEGHYFAKAPKPEAPRPPKGKVSQKESEARPDKKEAPAPAEKMEVLGCVKSFSEDRGYGFLASEAAPGDIYFRAGDVPSDDAAQVGRYCSFTLHFKDGHPQARSLCWLTEEVPLTSRAEGFVKSLGANYGFITSKAIGVHDIYVESGLHVGGRCRV